MRDKLVYICAAIGALLLAWNLHDMFLVLPDEAAQGAIYRIIFFHVPAVFTAFTGFFVALVLGVVYLATGNLKYDAVSASIIEVSFVFACINVATGSLWGRIIWGIWWTWDARLTSMFVCLLIYAGYLMLRKSIDEPTQRGRLSSALAIFNFVDVVIVWKSIEWWRTQHPGPVLSIRTGGGNIDPSMEHMIYRNFLALLFVAAAIILVRIRQEETAREIDSLRRLAHA